MDNIIAVIILIIIIAVAITYIYKQKKKGNKCIGCPYSSECTRKNCNNNI